MLDSISRWLADSPMMRYFARAGLRFKLVFLVALVAIVGVLASSSLVLFLQRKQLESSALQSTTRLSDAVNASLQQAMLRNDRQMTNETVRTLVDKQSIEHIRILDANGIVHVSSLPSEVGERFSYAEPTCQFCHTNRARPSNQTTIIETKDGHTALLNVNMIYNQPQCQSCHTEPVLGLTMIEMPLVDLNNQLASGFWQIVISLLATFILMIVLLIVALNKLTIQPIDQLARGMSEIQNGNLDHALEIPGRDELGRLAESFDKMRAQLKSTRDENIGLNRKMRSIGVLQERDRLARELHDNLAQMLGYINIKAALIDDLLSKNQTTQARSSLLELKQVSKEAYTDVRESIFYLRTAPNGSGLIPMLKEYLADYHARYGINTHLWIEDERLAEFPEEVQVQVNRIVQEALTNVRKHSQANQARVRFERYDHHVKIDVEDNGIGFDLDKLKQNSAKHFGLQIMQERAESVGGRLEIDSQAGVGTRITLCVPMYPIIGEDPHD